MKLGSLKYEAEVLTATFGPEIEGENRDQVPQFLQVNTDSLPLISCVWSLFAVPSCTDFAIIDSDTKEGRKNQIMDVGIDTCTEAEKFNENERKD